MRLCTQIHRRVTIPQSLNETSVFCIFFGSANGVRSMTIYGATGPQHPTPRMLMWVGLEHKRALKMAREQ